MRTLVLLATVVAASNTAMAQIQPVSHSQCGDCCSEGCLGYQPCDWQACCNASGTACCTSSWCSGQGNWCSSCNGYGGNSATCMGGLCYDRCSNCPMGLCESGSCLTDCQAFRNSCLGQCCATKAFPDAGWAPPVRYPVNRDGIWYGSYLPQAYYGNPGGGFIGNYPMVYQPTDTTQLGYYYAKVPTWQHRPGMIPPAPVPGQFHARGCVTGNGTPYGLCVHQGIYGGNNVNNYATGYAMAHPAPFSGYAMQRPSAVRPRSNNHAGKRNPFSLTALAELFD